MMKKMMKVCLCFAFMMVMAGCQKESEKLAYDEAEVLAKGEAIITELNDGKYQEVLDKGTKEIKAIGDQLQAGMEEYVIPLGAFQKIDDHEIVASEESITLGIIAIYEKGNIQYTFAFDKDGVMTGIWMKQV